MDEDNYGQIDIYDQLFEGLDESSIRGDAYECILKKTSYLGFYKNKQVPIMVGSKFDKGRNPLNVRGYFVINGICKTINNIKFYQRGGFSRDRAVLSDKTKVTIDSMFVIKNSTNKRWYLPENWREMIKYSKDPDKLSAHLNLIKGKKESPKIKEEVDLIILCYMFDAWLGLREPLETVWRLLTPGEIIYDAINNPFDDVLNNFNLNRWRIKYINNVYTVSEDMKHYNIFSDVEAVRRVSVATNRELISKENRMVKWEEKGIFCPVQTPDGQVCGTVNYLVLGATVISDLQNNVEFEPGNDVHLFINSDYQGLTSEEFIKKLVNKKYRIVRQDKLCYAYYYYGYVIPSETNIFSSTATCLKHIYHNPPIRGMFVTSMIKQAIMYDDRGISELISNIKHLENNISMKCEVAIMPWYGYNIEDGIVISRKVSEKYRYYKNIFYEARDVVVLNVYVKENQYVHKNQRLYRVYDEREIQTIVTAIAEDEGYIYKIYDDHHNIKIIVKKTSNLVVGDKITSLHGQKGVVSLIEDNMPYYYKNGTRIEIDILINPHAFPSRMTMGQIVEMGAEEHQVYINDKPITNKIIVGKCKYLALRHQVSDKLQFTDTDEYDIITRQPKYGLRFGQMERDILFAVNANDILRELWNIDLTNINWCRSTGVFKPKCNCQETISINQFFIICLSIIRALGFDILFKDGKYKICKLDPDLLKITGNKYFGDLDVTDVRIYGGYRLLPIALRTDRLRDLYGELNNLGFDAKENEKLMKEYYKLLRSKDGYYHKYFEGHKVNKCMRSVITPNPKLDIDTVEVPNISIGEYGLLNRQPSLNIDSLKFVRLKKGDDKTLKMNPLLCKSFNADFDGDEMNIYILKDEKSIAEAKEKLLITPKPTQDYILDNDLEKLTETGLTANKAGFMRMINEGSKGKQFNYDYAFDKIGKVGDTIINENYFTGISSDNWYLLSISAREHAISIALNTPVTGKLQSLTVQSLL